MESKIDLKAEDENGKTAEQIAEDVKVRSSSGNLKAQSELRYSISPIRKMRWLLS